jgi:osmotically inducible lipoprotein OsmB
MNSLKVMLCASALAITAGCASWGPTETGIAVGAAAGGVVGSAVTGGSTLGTVGGAAAGGLIGHEVGKRREGR